MQVLISAAGRYNTFMLAVLALAMSALVIAACDSTIVPDTGATIEPGDEIVLGKGHQVAVCHVGHKLPEYDPACTEGCGDAGKIDLIFVPQKAVGKHVGNPAHTYGGVSDYYPGDAGATGEGQEDTSDNGVYVDDGCVIPVDADNALAVAYIDRVDDGGGYDPGVDVLISQLVDANGDGVPSAGDRIVMGNYPTDFDGGPTGTWGFTEREVVGVWSDSVPSVWVTVEDGSYTHSWMIYPSSRSGGCLFTTGGHFGSYCVLGFTEYAEFTDSRGIDVVFVYMESADPDVNCALDWWCDNDLETDAPFFDVEVYSWTSR